MRFQRISWACALVVSSLGGVAVVARQGRALTLDEVLFRANMAIIAYLKEFSSVVAQEQYEQRVVRPDGSVKRMRVTTSDYLLVRVPEDDSWMGFRDVIEVDGAAVGDRQERLYKLFLESPRVAMTEARKIANESARYNIGEIARNVNIPTMPLLFLHPLNQHRFYFEKTGEEDLGGPRVWAVRYTEHVRPTLVRSGRMDIFARGTMWIDPASGRVLKTELMLGDANTPVRTTILVTYRHDAVLGTFVPVVMEEQYDDPRNPRADRILARAAYAHFRRFEVRTQESIRPPH